MAGNEAAALDNRVRFIREARENLRIQASDGVLDDERQVRNAQHDALAAISSHLSMLGGAARKLDRDARRHRLQSLKRDQREISKAMRDLGPIR